MTIFQMKLHSSPLPKRPKAVKPSKLTENPIFIIPYYHFTVGTVAGVENVIISNTGYTSSRFEIYFKMKMQKTLG